MNIDYAAIIEKANVRREALKEFEQAVQRLSGEINESHDPELICAMHDFCAAAKALDQEAQGLLPEDALSPVLCFAQNLISMWAYLDKSGTGCKAPDTPRTALYRLNGK